LNCISDIPNANGRRTLHLDRSQRKRLIECAFIDSAGAVFGGDMQLGHDGDFINLSAGSDAIASDNLL
jgi:hypothetical protein